MTRVEEEAVARLPAGVLGVILQKLAEEHVDEVCATHSTARVTTLSFFYCCGSQDTNVIRCTIQKLCLVHSNKNLYCKYPMSNVQYQNFHPI